MVITAAVVVAVGTKDWSPKAIVAREPVVSSEEEDGPERLRLEKLDGVRGIRWTGGRDLFRYVEKRVEVAPVRAVGTTQAAAESHAGGAGQATKKDVVPHVQFFGVAKKGSVERALFCDEEQVYVAVEGDVIGGRYRVVRIGMTVVEIEDLERHTRETLAMATS